VLAAARAELLVLRKWPAAWGLMLVAPALTLVTYYVVTFVDYLTVTPAQYAQLGSPSQMLPAMLPSQFVIAATEQFSFSAVAPFVVLGAVMAGGDWGRGTIGTSLVSGPGRVRTGAGQALALAVALASSVVATFAVSGAASLVVRALEAHAVNPVDAAMPAAWVIVRGLGVAMLIALAYGSLGLALGTVCRSAAGAIGAALLWTVLIEPNLADLGQQAGGMLKAISNVFPVTSADTLTSLFGSPGGGAASQMYLPIGPTVAAWTLAGYTVGFLGLTLVLLYRRDVLTGRTSRRRRATTARPALAAAGPAPLAPPADAAQLAPLAPPADPAPGRASGALASLRAELLVMRNRPTVWALVLILPVDMLIGSYLTDYVYYRTAATGLTVGVNGPQVLSAMLPGQYLTSALSGFGIYSEVYGSAVFVLLGALIAGSDWGRGTIKTALLAGPDRLQTRIGQDLAVMLAAAAGVALTFLLAAGVSAATAAALARSAPSLASRFPVFTQVAASVGGALILALACTAIGLALGVVLRSATKAAAAVLLWAVVIQPNLNQVSTQLHGVPLRLYDILPDASINTVVNLYNSTIAGVPGTSISPPSGVEVAPALAFATLGLYLVVCLAIPALITARRSIT
jgi:ABC-2 type transport system permease protein